MSDFNPFHVRIDIKGKPIPKKRPRFTRTGIVYSDKAQLQQEKAVRILGKAAMKGNPPIIFNRKQWSTDALRDWSFQGKQ